MNPRARGGMAAGERGASRGTTEAAAAGEVGEVDGGGVGEAGEKGNNKDSGRGRNFVNEKVIKEILCDIYFFS